MTLQIDDQHNLKAFDPGNTMAPARRALPAKVFCDCLGRRSCKGAHNVREPRPTKGTAYRLLRPVPPSSKLAK